MVRILNCSCLSRMGKSHATEVKFIVAAKLKLVRKNDTSIFICYQERLWADNDSQRMGARRLWALDQCRDMLRSCHKKTLRQNPEHSSPGINVLASEPSRQVNPRTAQLGSWVRKLERSLQRTWLMNQAHVTSKSNRCMVQTPYSGGMQETGLRSGERLFKATYSSYFSRALDIWEPAVF